MKRALLLVLVLCASFVLLNSQRQPLSTETPPPGKNSPTATEEPRSLPGKDVGSADSILADAFARRQSNLQVTGRGTVSKLLADDTSGSRHQKFILKLSSGQTLLVAHNIDIAQRVANLREGDVVEFFAEYE